jgi:hypothetical protein
MNKSILKFIILLIIFFGITVSVMDHYAMLPIALLMVDVAIFTYFVPARLFYEKQNEPSGKFMIFLKAALKISIEILLLCILSVLIIYTTNPNLMGALWCMIFIPAGIASLPVMLISWISYILIEQGRSVSFIISMFILFSAIYLLIIINYVVSRS